MITDLSFGMGGGSGGIAIPAAFGASFVAAGDSITENGGTLGSSLATLVGRGYWVWAAQLSDSRILPAHGVNAGITGNTSTQLVARYAADVTSKSPKVVFLLIGTNDITAGTAASVILANIDTMIAANRAIGTITILGRILPRGSVGVPMSAPQIAIWEAANNGITARAAADVKVWDAEPVIGNMDAAHTIKVGRTTAEDKLHPNTLGGYEIGTVVSPILNTVVASGDSLFQTNNAAGNFVPNGFMTGTGGTLGGATGQVATGWTADISLGGGAALAVSKVARGDGFGEWQQFALSGTFNGNDTKATIYRQSVSTVISISQWVQGEMEIQVDLTTAKISSVQLLCVIGSGAYTVASQAPYPAEVAGANADYNGVIRTQPFQLPAGITLSDFYLRVTQVDVATSTAISDIVRVGRVGFKIIS
jgi:lysophospholipase L1-like esterase